MGVFTEYLDSFRSYEEHQAERKKQLARIAEARGGSQVLVYAADQAMARRRGNDPSIEYADLMHFGDQLSGLSGDQLDLIIETPGGSGEVAHDMVRMIRNSFSRFCVLIPGWSKSAGTIIAMGADEIVMLPSAALGPIDAQISRNGNVVSADAFLKGFEDIKKEVAKSNQLNRAYIPMLQGITPGDLKGAQNALDYARDLVQDWLVNYKFASWTTHSSGDPVTDEERLKTATDIADKLCAQSAMWKTHGRSLMIQDLRDLGLKITDASDGPDLSDALQRYAALLRLTFERTSIYKMFETTETFVCRHAAPQGGGPVVPKGKGNKPQAAHLNIKCDKCGTDLQVQANFVKGVSLEPGFIPFPKDNEVDCPTCSARVNIANVRNDLEARLKRTIITDTEVD